jgi:hypothetical protein
VALCTQATDVREFMARMQREGRRPRDNAKALSDAVAEEQSAES